MSLQSILVLVIIFFLLGVGIVFIFLKEVIGARESYLVNILVYFFSRKTYTMVGLQ